MLATRKQKSGKWIPKMCLQQPLHREAAHWEGLLTKKFSGVFPMKKFTKTLSASRTRRQQMLSGTKRRQMTLPKGECHPLNMSAWVSCSSCKHLIILARIVSLELISCFEIKSSSFAVFSFAALTPLEERVMLMLQKKPQEMQ